MTLGERIKKLRKDQNLTLEEFGSRIRVGNSSISRIERGVTKPSEQTLLLICAEYDVREAWLRDGTGPMYEESQKDKLSDLMQTFGLPEAFRGLLAAYRALPSDREREIVCRYIERAAAEIRDGQPPSGEGTGGAEESEDLEAWAEEQARRYKRQLLQERRRVSSASSQSVSGEAGAGTDVDSA